MKPKLWLLFFLLLCNFTVYSQAKKPINNFTLKGTIADHNIHAIWLRYTVNDEKRVRLKAQVKNGSFLFKGSLASPVYAEFFFDDVQPHGDYGFNRIFLSPGKITVSLIKDNIEHTKITGSVMQDDWDRLDIQKQEIEKAKNTLNTEANKLRAAGNTPKNHAGVMKLNSELDKFSTQEKQIDFTFITAHPASYLSPYLTSYYFDMEELTLDSAAMFYNTFTSQVKNSFAGKSLLNNISKHKSSTIGAIAPLFVKTDINKKQVDLKSFRDKNYVLLYFWASWCLYHSNEGKHLNQLYNTFHPNGLELIGLSLDFFKKDLKKAIIENDMTRWRNVMIPNDTIIETKYNIKGMPPSILILIDKKGKIIGRYMGEHAVWVKKTDNEGEIIDLDKKLAEILGK